jgi:mediator of replication checkpoint protein 1
MEERAKSRPKRSALVDEQAEESDEDNGWLRADAGEDENDDEEDDGRDLQDLVDDQAVNEEEKKRQDALAEEKRR